jgi:hypothetical protein
MEFRYNSVNPSNDPIRIDERGWLQIWFLLEGPRRWLCMCHFPTGWANEQDFILKENPGPSEKAIWGGHRY